MSIARSSFVFAAGTLVSRLSGLLRDMVITHILGAGPLHDAFVVAQRIPNLLRDMLAEGAMGSSFTKVYTALKEQDSDAADRLLFQMLYLCFLVSLALICTGIGMASHLVNLMSLGSSPSELFQQTAVSLTQIFFPSLGMSVIGAVAMGALYQKGKFFFNALIPVLANLGVIAGGLFLGRLIAYLKPDAGLIAGQAEVLGLAWGTLLGFFLQMAAALLSVRKSIGYLVKELWASVPWSGNVGSVLRLMGPAVVATSAAPINAIINTNFATSVGQGAVTWLTYSFRILQLPIGIFGVAAGVYALPALTRAVIQAGKKVDHDVSAQLQQACIFVSWLLVPCMVYALVNHHMIIDFLFRHGHYTVSDVDATGKALFAYSFSMLAYGLIKVMTAFYYATDRTSFAMKVSLASIGINFLGNWFLVDKFGHIGLAFTSSLTLSINACILLWGSYRMGVIWQFHVLRRQAAWMITAATIFLGLSLLNHAVLGLFESIMGRMWILIGQHDVTWLSRIQELGFLIYNGILVLMVFTLCAMKAYGLGWGDVKRRVPGLSRL